MSYLAVLLTVLYSALSNGNTFLHECAKYCRPKNYFDVLPNLNMPYVNRLPIPNDQLIKNRDYMNKIDQIQPSPVLITKVISVKTKYVYKNPVCVKYSRKQKFCMPENVKNKENAGKLVTKDYFIRHSDDVEKRVSTVDSAENEDNDVDSMDADRFNLKVSFSTLESSEYQDTQEPRSFQYPIAQMQTPSLPTNSIDEMLIEDRLDQLETILPNYTRRRQYETRTLYVTKTISNRRSMATLMVKNCVPLGYEICPRKVKNSKKKKKKKNNKERKSKVAKSTLDSGEKDVYFG